MIINPHEIIESILFLNPDAKCSVFEDGTIKYGSGHKGIKPTLAECESVKGQVLSTLKAAEDDKKAKEALTELYVKSIKPILEYIAAKPDAPPDLKTIEAEAVEERSKL